MTSDFLSIVGAITGVTSMIISLLDHQRNRFYAVHEYLTMVESDAFVEAKKYVYNTDCFEATDEQAAIIVNFFHHWGMLAKRGYLPMWVFDGATGNGACRLYERVLPYITLRQELNHDPLYGEYFLWLYKKIKRRNKQ